MIGSGYMIGRIVASETPRRLEIVANRGSEIEYTFVVLDGVERVQTNSVVSAEADEDDITENDNGRYTVTGFTADGYGDAFEIGGDVISFQPVEGEYTLYLNGERISREDLVEPVVEREHSYSFEGTGDDWADYYLEVEDDAEMVASTLDDAVIEPDFHWVSEDGTKAAGRVDPGERHAYKFDNLVLDVTIEGEADAFVDGSPSDLDYYPRPGATGDGWKGGFPWQEDSDSQEGVIGGGPGYEHAIQESDADVVVRNRSDLVDALSAASSGDVVFVPGSVNIDLGDNSYNVPSGVTLASDRGVDGSSGALLSTGYEVKELIRLHGNARLTGIRLTGPHPGDDWTGSSNAGGAETLGAGEIDNCDVRGFSHHGLQADTGDGAHIHHNVIRENNKSGLGYGVAAASGTPIIEYNYFNNNRHSVATGGDNPGYILRYNHFGSKEVLHNIDAHAPAGRRYEIHNNVIETTHREWDGNENHIVVIRDAPDDVATIYDNWFFNPNAPDSDGPTDSAGQTIIQPNQESWTNLEFHDNFYGENANVSFSDIIPGYDGWRT